MQVWPAKENFKNYLCKYSLLKIKRKKGIMYISRKFKTYTRYLFCGLK